MTPARASGPGSASPSPFATTTWALACIAALLLVVLTLHLTPVLFAGLIAFAASRSLARKLERLRLALRPAQSSRRVRAPVLYAQLKHALQRRGML